MPSSLRQATRSSGVAATPALWSSPPTTRTITRSLRRSALRPRLRSAPCGGCLISSCGALAVRERGGWPLARRFDPELPETCLTDVLLRLAPIVDIAPLVASGDDLECHSAEPPVSDRTSKVARPSARRTASEAGGAGVTSERPAPAPCRAPRATAATISVTQPRSPIPRSTLSLEDQPRGDHAGRAEIEEDPGDRHRPAEREIGARGPEQERQPRARRRRSVPQRGMGLGQSSLL